MTKTLRPPLISKSSYMAGLQCPKLLWHKLNEPEVFPEPDALTQAVFDQGTAVGTLAKRLFPKGLEIGARVIDKRMVDELSRAALAERRPLFEAGFIAGRAYARADVLVPVGRKQWDLVEVKSSTKVKEEHIPDVALQRHVYEGAGLDIRRCSVMHIDRAYVRRGGLDPRKLFARTEVTEEVEEVGGDVAGNLDEMARVVDQPQPPKVKIGPHCFAPYECPLQDLCWKALPKHNVFSLTRVGNQAFDWYHRGFLRLQDLPRDEVATGKQAIQMAAIRSGRPHVEREAIGGFLDRIEYPLYLLDFETVGPALPLWNGSRPYQQVPFQFSLHVVEAPGGKPSHHAHLAEGRVDPRPEILARLKNLLDKRGSIVAYNAKFESQVLEESTEAYPAFAAWWKRAEPRMVDLLVPFRNFHYYHPDQLGHASLKNVLPALTGRSYEGMEIAEGVTASLEYLRVTFGDVSQAERRHVRAALEKYCALDTFGMVEIVRKLEELVGDQTPRPEVRARRSRG
ncbi:MAG: DUF2779 domain-containing protein [Deltaproteobacteria bacterium]|nr:DUF2779 domain-containing protein [Deltaproteobacteria bacterium]